MVEQNELVEVQAEPAGNLVLPNGAIIDLRNTAEVAQAYRDLETLLERAKVAKAILTEALYMESQRQGRRTFAVGEFEVEINAGNSTDWGDHDELRDELRAAGCPEDRLNDLFKQTITEKVNASVVRQLMTNPDYKAVLERRKVTTPKTPYATVKQ